MPHFPEDSEFSRFVAQVGAFNHGSVLEFLARYLTAGLDHTPTGGSRPWDVTPVNISAVAHHLLRFARPEGGERLTEKHLEVLLKEFYNLSDPMTFSLRKSQRLEDQHLQAARQEYLQSFHDVRGDLFFQRLIDAAGKMAEEGLTPVRCFGLDAAQLARVPHILGELARHYNPRLRVEHWETLTGSMEWPAFSEALALPWYEFDQAYDNQFNYEFFSTVWNPLLDKPCLAMEDESLICLVPSFLEQRLPEIWLEECRKQFGDEARRHVNDHLIRSMIRLAKRLMQEPTLHHNSNAPDERSRWSFLLAERTGDSFLVMLSPVEPGAMKIRSSHIQQVYESVAGELVDTVAALARRFQGVRDAVKRIQPLVVSAAPLRARNVQLIQADIQRLLREKHGIGEREVPRYDLIDLTEFEQALELLPRFHSLKEMLVKKRAGRFERRSLREFLVAEVPGEVRTATTSATELREVRSQCRRLVRNRMK